jgi:hypothetical protein
VKRVLGPLLTLAAWGGAALVGLVLGFLVAGLVVGR